MPRTVYLVVGECVENWRPMSVWSIMSIALLLMLLFSYLEESLSPRMLIALQKVSH